MDKIDARIIKQLKSSKKVNNGLVKTMSKEIDKVDALVRVRNPLQLGLLERNFEVAACYPFIRSIGIKCGLGDAIKLERMNEVEYVCAQSKAFMLTDELSNGDELRATRRIASRDCEKIQHGRVKF